MRTKIALLTILCLLIGVSAHAQSSKGKTIGLGMNPQLADYIARKVIAVNTSGNIEIPVASGKTFVVSVAGTPVANLGATGLSFVSSTQQIGNTTFAPVMTPGVNLTPVAAQALVAPASIMATASPTLAYVTLPVATANAGKVFGVYNKGASPLLINANGIVTATDVINALAAATPFSCATTKYCECRVIGTGSYVCLAHP